MDAGAKLDRLLGMTVLITGADGMLGRAFREVLEPLAAGCRVLALDRARLDVTDRASVLPWASERPDLILHCAAIANADVCEHDPATCRRVQVDGTANMAELARRSGARVFYPQSVFIFDGRELPVTEATVPAPLSAYGRHKLEAERRLLSDLPDSLVVRMAGFFGGDDKDKNFVGQFTRRLAALLDAGETRHRVGDRVWQPSYTLDLARNSLLLIALGGTGVYHMGALGEASFYEVAEACVDLLGLGSRIAIEPCPASLFADREQARRPMRMVTAMERLDREGLNRQRHWRTALAEYLARPHFDGLRARRDVVHVE